MKVQTASNHCNKIMAKKQSAAHAEQLHHLRTLASDRRAQVAFAVTLLAPRNGAEAILAALQILTSTPHAPAREALLALYADYGGRNEKRDPAAYMRAAILRALREIVLPTDVPFLAAATATYVFPPPDFKEEGAMLRAAALLALAEIEDDLARYHAVRLLANEHTDSMSGEPALTAAKVLATQGEIIPLYFYVMQDGARVLPEVVSTCLSNLTALRPDLLPGILARYAESKNEIILVGLFDLLLNHQAGLQATELITHFLQQSQQLDAYRYLVVTMATSGKPDVVQLLIKGSQLGVAKAKVAILREAMTLVPATEPSIIQFIEQLDRFPANPGRGNR